MKLLNADKLIEFIEANKEQIDDKYGERYIIDVTPVVSVISTNSIDIDYSDKIKGRCKDCKWIYTPECRMYEVQVAQNYKEIGSQYCSEFEPKVDVKTTDKSCPTCEHYSTDVDDEGYPIVLAPCDICGDDMDNWTPKADKVEGDKTNEHL